MKKIAVICALPPERNTGMATVDLTAHSVIHDIAPDAEVTMYTYGKPNQYTYQEGELPFQLVDIMDKTDAFLQSDAFIYWGDFTHSHAYWEKDRGDWDADATLEKLNEIKDACAKYMFLSDLPQDELKKAIVFGSTIITNEASDGLDGFYAEHSKRFFENAGNVYFRDALSAAKVAPMRESQASLACDCAMLLRDADLEQLPDFHMATTRKDVGIFFGRTQSKWQMLLFARAVSKQLGVPSHWIPWFATFRRLRMLARLFGVTIPKGQPSAGELLSMLSGYRYIVTDTYHLCVNAWRMGIPAICIGKGAGVSESSLSDKKKEVLYEMYGARKFYVFLESFGLMGGGIFAAARQAAAALKDEALVEQVSANIHSHRDMSYTRLKDAVEKALDAETPKAA